MLTRFPCNFFEVPFDSRMNRSLLIAEPIGGVNGQPLLVATAHLESLNNSELRMNQLQMSIDILSRTCKNNLMMGDFNFHSTWKDQQAVIHENGYSDVYLDLKGGDETFTMLKTKRYDGWRPDKVILPVEGCYL